MQVSPDSSQPFVSEPKTNHAPKSGPIALLFPHIDLNLNLISEARTQKHISLQSITTVASEPLSLSSTPSSPSASLFDSKTKWASTLADNLTRGTKPPESGEPYVLLPTQFFSLHYHLQFNPAPPYESNSSKKTSGPSSISGSGAKCNCNCGTWTMFCLPPHLGGCGHRYVQDVLYCGRTIDESQPERALSTVCPGIDPSRIIKCAGYMMGLCPTCRRDAAVVQVRSQPRLDIYSLLF